MLQFTNSLIYSTKMVSSLTNLTKVTLTHSCSYPLGAFNNSLTYKVQLSDLTIETGRNSVNFDVRLAQL